MALRARTIIRLTGNFFGIPNEIIDTHGRSLGAIGICSELRISVALLENIGRFLLAITENITRLLLRLRENELTIPRTNSQTSGSAHNY